MDGPIPMGRKRKWTCRNYRRALQILRLKHSGHSDYSDIRVHIWINGGSGIPFELLQSSVSTEFEKFRKKTLRPITTNFDIQADADQNDGRKNTLVRQMGEASPEILPVGFKYSTDELTGLYGLMRSGETNDAQALFIRGILSRFGIPVHLVADLSAIIDALVKILAGIAGAPDEGFAESAVDTIQGANAESFENARILFVQVRSALSCATTLLPLVAEHEPTIAGLQKPMETLGNVLKSNPWQLGTFVVFLRLALQRGDKGASLATLLTDLFAHFAAIGGERLGPAIGPAS